MDGLFVRLDEVEANSREVPRMGIGTDCSVIVNQMENTDNDLVLRWF